MTILLLPIPPKPTYFGPDGAPPGVRLMLDAFNTLDDGLPWTPTRPKITPRVGVVHTNSASYESTTEGQIKWGRNTTTKQKRNTTKPHYLVNEPFAAKVLRTDLRGIANSTTKEAEDEWGEQDSSFWTYAIETADTGTIADPAISDFLTAGQSKHGPVNIPHAELVARIFAYESIVHGHPIAVPGKWNGTGIATHTWPYPYPFYTIVPGKTCPGGKKIATFRNEIVARADMIRAAWLDNQEDTDMITLDQPRRVYDSRTMHMSWGPGDTRNVFLGDGLSEAFINITVVAAQDSEGFISVNDAPNPKTSVVNYSRGNPIESNGVPVKANNGNVVITNSVGWTHVIVDVFAQK